MLVTRFSPLIRHCFKNRFSELTEPQRRGWPSIATSRDKLIVILSRLEKTRAVFLACLEQLCRNCLKDELKRESQIIYMPPLQALSTGIEDNLQTPLHG
ncbi:MAG: hypothetical protein MK165_12395 [Pirellulaceae bacterium]|nr:hypothetical protein [Pirellulaceae bacterium]